MLLVRVTGIRNYLNTTENMNKSSSVSAPNPVFDSTFISMNPLQKTTDPEGVAQCLNKNAGVRFSFTKRCSCKFSGNYSFRVIGHPRERFEHALLHTAVWQQDCWTRTNAVGFAPLGLLYGSRVRVDSCFYFAGGNPQCSTISFLLPFRLRGMGCEGLL